MLVAIGFLFSFLWNLKSGQYDDVYSPSVRMLIDAERKKDGNTKSKRYIKASGTRQLTEEV